MSSLYDFLETNSMYVVLFIVLIIWIGIFAYIWGLDKKVRKMESEN